MGENKLAEEKISYVKFGDHATNLPSNVRFATNGVFNESIQYRYDSMGNIVEVFENGRSACRYEYDALGRLTREDNVAFGKTTTWAYDNNGNILARYEYAITAKPTSELHLLDCTCFNYAYDDNSDQLMSYNGETFVYDQIGNPAIYRGKAATWAYGRQLTSFDGNTFAYDARGRRTAKNGITFTYDRLHKKRTIYRNFATTRNVAKSKKQNLQTKPSINPMTKGIFKFPKTYEIPFWRNIRAPRDRYFLSKYRARSSNQKMI